MLTAYAVTPEALKKSIKLGAISFLSKEKIVDLKEFLEVGILNKGKPLWRKLFDQLEGFFNRRFGPDWKEKDKIFIEISKGIYKA